MNKTEQLMILRHSGAHLLAHAIKRLFPDTKLTLGPATETGFFYDVQPVRNFKEEDLPAIEEMMRQLVKENHPITGGQVPKSEARGLYKDNQFKLELIDGIPGETVGIYTQGDFFDLCKGGHAKSLGELGHFKLMALSGSYWRADRNGIPLQRIYGVIFETKKELDEYLQRLEDVKKYDHRVLGKQLDLFSFHDEAPGMAFWHDKGLKLYNKLVEFARSKIQHDYIEIKTPFIMNEQIWKTSGHYTHYKENMYFTQIDETFHCMKPMNCPSAMMVYNEKPHSYRELPLRIAEFGQVHRHELSGVLHGLFRVRSFTQDDGHIFCSVDQIGQEVHKMLELAKEIYAPFKFPKIKMALSTRPAKAIGSEEYWQKATDALKEALVAADIDYILQEGDGAFYGPKIDIKIEDAMGREWQCGTIQVDFFQPQNFKCEFIKADQSRETPVVLHRAIFGSIERFLGVITEHFKGHFPFWLSPVQIRILTITDGQKEYARELQQQLVAAGLRVEIDEHPGDKISAQIKRAQMEKIPWMLVLGAQEMANKTATLRHTTGEQEAGLTVEQLIAKATADRKSVV